MLARMTFPETAPYDHGMLDTGDGNLVHWEVCGNPDGKPAVVVHGGPGSGAGPFWRRYFDPARYRVVLFDQRGCGRSTPPVSDAETGLETNTTHHLIADMEQLREHLGIAKWLVFGGSWGSTLGLAYAQTHPERVSEIVLFSVVTTSRAEVDWITEGVRVHFPDAWAAYRDAAQPREGERVVDAYARLLADPDPAVREEAARNWCRWEETHVQAAGAQLVDEFLDERFSDPAFRMTYARLVTHYWRHAAWLDDGQLVDGVRKWDSIPGVLVTGGLDLSSPPDPARALAAAWPGCELLVIDEAGHGLGHSGMSGAAQAALDRFARH
ncbi:proline iminopeptidase [Streptomyces violascens]|uniref:Proline iminopeptidase n=2 Tax=Streptomyces violascens TaxID=67381 RepID=A0ABQ3QKU1_9ACTN|nr:proline iminopeptidase [Streptomyces violascens]GHI37859.1 proline iminopeptidase [Streptomyces violascens]